MPGRSGTDRQRHLLRRLGSLVAALTVVAAGAGGLSTSAVAAATSAPAATSAVATTSAASSAVATSPASASQPTSVVAPAPLSIEAHYLGSPSYLTDPACAPDGDCVAVGDSFWGGAVLRSTTGHWVNEAVPAGVGGLAAAACPTDDLCIAGGVDLSGEGGRVITSSDQGRTWTVHHLPSGTGGIDALACPTATHCVAAAEAPFTGDPQALVTWDGGTVWRAGRVPADADYFTGVSCSSDQTCVAIGPSVTVSDPTTAYRSSNGGRSWRRVGGVRKLTLAAVWCTTGRCVAVGATGSHELTAAAAVSYDGGRVWHASRIPARAGRLAAVSCAGARCAAVGADRSLVGGTIATSRDRGRVWRVHPMPRRGADLSGVTCNPTRCVATGEVDKAGQGVVTSSDAGRSWRQATTPVGIDEIDSVSCPTRLDCVAVGTTVFATDVALYTRDGGRTWHRATVRGYQDDLYSVSCGTPTWCVAVGSIASFSQETGSVAVTTDGGVMWHTRKLPHWWDLTSVDCPTSRSCVAVGSTQFFPALGEPWHPDALTMSTSDRGARWTTRKDSSAASFLGVSCPSPHRCVAIAATTKRGTVLVASTGPGATWRSQPSLPPGAGGYAISCASARRCLTLAETSKVSEVLNTVNGGRSWHTTVSQPSSRPRDGFFDTVSCAPGGPCIVAGAAPSSATVVAGEYQWLRATGRPLARPVRTSTFIDGATVTASTVQLVGDTGSGTAVIGPLGRTAVSAGDGVAPAVASLMSPSPRLLPPSAWVRGLGACRMGPTSPGVGPPLAGWLHSRCGALQTRGS